MSNELLINLTYVVAAVLFISGLKMLSSPATARNGNLVSACGMLLAIVVTLLDHSIVDFRWIIVGLVVGGMIGALAARLIAMTAMPEMVALLNGFGGIASLFVGWAALHSGADSTFTIVTIFLSILIGGLTFTGSLIAYGKLSEVISGRPYIFTGQRIFNSLLLLRHHYSRCDVLYGTVEYQLAVCPDRPVVPVRRHGGHPHRRRRHARGDFITQQLFRPCRLCRRFCHQQQHPDRRRFPGGRHRHHPHQHHVQGHEPLPGQRAVQRLRRGQDGPDQGGRRGKTHYAG